MSVEIDSMLSGKLKLQEKEFEVLPKLWELLDRCFYQLLFVTSTELNYAEIDRMNEAEVEELMDNTHFPESQKDQIRVAKIKSPLYKSFLTYERVTDALGTSTDLGNYLSLNGILIPLELKDKFTLMTASLTGIAHRLRSIVLQTVMGKIYDHHVQVLELRPLLDDIEATIQSRLASHAKSHTK